MDLKLTRYCEPTVCVSVCLSVCVHTHAHACSVMSDSLQPHGLKSTRFLRPWNFSGNNTGARCHFSPPGRNSPTQGLNSCFLCLLHCRQILYPLSQQKSPLKVDSSVCFLLADESWSWYVFLLLFSILSYFPWHSRGL